jgi:hypothetical protein
VDDAVVKAADAVECFARDGIEKTMQVFNAPPQGERDSTSLPPRGEP